MSNEVILTNSDGGTVTLKTAEQIENFMRKAQQDIAPYLAHYEKHGAMTDADLDRCAILVERWNANAQAIERFNERSAANRLIQVAKAAQDIVDQQI